MKFLNLYIYIVLALTLTAVSCNTEQAKEDEKIVQQDNKSNNPMVRPIAQGNVEGGIDWLSMDDLSKISKNDKKKVLVDVYTDWCGWCKVMDKKTFTDPQVKEVLKEFHVVKFNAEQKDPIVFKGKEYTWVPSGRRGVNMLAVELLNGRLGYPTMVYLDEDLNKIRASAGYKTPEKLLAELSAL